MKLQTEEEQHLDTLRLELLRAGYLYNKKRTQKQALSGVFHGAGGHFRATNTIALADMLKTAHDKLAILALAWAVLQPAKKWSWGTRGSGLCDVLAHLLMKGLYTYQHKLADKEFSVNKDTLKSDYFSPLTIETAKKMFETHTLTEDLALTTYGELNHDATVTALIQSEIETAIPAASKPTFYQLVSLFRRVLHRSPDDLKIDINQVNKYKLGTT